MNIDTMSKWGIDALCALQNNNITQEERVLLQWVEEKPAFILEMSSIIKAIQDISILLKNHGLSQTTKLKCISMIGGCNDGRSKELKHYIMNYLDEHTKEIKHQDETILCCSDIIESAFGRYKNELAKNPMSGITDLALIIPALTAKLTEDSIIQDIDSCTVKEIKLWREKNLCSSMLAKKRKTFVNKRGEDNFIKCAI